MCLCSLPFNTAKNRYRNVIPCDATRVELKDPDPLVGTAVKFVPCMLIPLDSLLCAAYITSL